jgi:hypothetical protein
MRTPANPQAGAHAQKCCAREIAHRTGPTHGWFGEVAGRWFEAPVGGAYTVGSISAARQVQPEEFSFAAGTAGVRYGKLRSHEKARFHRESRARMRHRT